MTNVIGATAAEDVIWTFWGAKHLKGWRRKDLDDRDIPTLSRHMFPASAQRAKSASEVRLVALQVAIMSWQPLGIELANSI